MTTSTDPAATFDVVVTRDAARAAPLATALAAQGARVVALPCTRVEPPEPEAWAATRTAVAGVAPGGAVVVPSGNAAAALARALGEAAVAIPPAARVVAIGPATRDALARAGIAAEVPARADALGAADHLLGAPPRAVLWLRAAGGRPDGIDRLRAAGVEVTEAIAYRTVARDPADPDLAGGLAALGGAAVVAVYAPSQVAALDALLAPRGGLAALPAAVVAIGETTAAALRARGVAPAAVAASPEPAAMAAAVAAVYPRRR